jgi:hypothetical protein
MKATLLPLRLSELLGSRRIISSYELEGADCLASPSRFLPIRVLVVNDSGVKVVEVRHGLRGVGEEGKGVLPLAEFDGDVDRHHTPVGSFPVGEDSRVPYLLAVYINPNPDDHVFGLAPDGPVDLQVHGRVSEGLEGGLYVQGTSLLDDHLYSHIRLLFRSWALKNLGEG